MIDDSAHSIRMLSAFCQPRSIRGRAEGHSNDHAETNMPAFTCRLMCRYSTFAHSRDLGSCPRRAYVGGLNPDSGREAVPCEDQCLVQFPDPQYCPYGRANRMHPRHRCRRRTTSVVCTTRAGVPCKRARMLPFITGPRITCHYPGNDS